MIHREGYGIIVSIFAVALVISFLIFIDSENLFLKVLAGLSWSFMLFSLYFFRDPDREIPKEPGAIVAPADGKIIEVGDVQETEFINGPAKKISIFMNVFNVHVNRSPISGKVLFFRYQKGKFMPANLKDASLQNEQTVLGVEQNGQKLVFKQIAGLIARRIYCELREGHNVKRGERMGLIKFGSRVDVFMPAETMITVNKGDCTVAGSTIIGKLADVS